MRVIMKDETDELIEFESGQEKIKLDKPTSFYKGKTRIFPTEIREMLVNLPNDELKKIHAEIDAIKDHKILFPKIH